MTIYNARAIAAKVSTETKFYDKVTRFMRGERKCFSKSEIAAIKKAVAAECKLMDKALSECIPNDSK